MQRLRGVVHVFRRGTDKDKELDPDGGSGGATTGAEGGEAGQTSLYAGLQEAVPHMQTGDVLLQSGDGERLDYVNRILQLSSFTHVLLVVRGPPQDLVEKHARLMKHNPPYKQTVDTEDLYVFEAQTYGVLLRPLWVYIAEAQERAREHKQNFPIIWRPLSNPLRPCPAKATDYPGLLRVLDESAGVDYEKRPRQFLLGRFECERKDDHTSLFCSELIAWALREMELLPPTTVTANFMPGNFADEKGDHINQKLRWGPAQYQSMVRLKYQDANYGNAKNIVHRVLHAERFLETHRQQPFLPG
jgi:hypothetical protein